MASLTLVEPQSSAQQVGKKPQKPESSPNPRVPEAVLDSSTTATDAKDEQIHDLQMRLGLYKNYLGEVAQFRQPKHTTRHKTEVNIDPKWVRGLEIPVTAQQQRLVDPLVIVFDPITATFASMNEKLALGKQGF